MDVTNSPYSPECGKIAHPSRRIAQLALRRVLAGMDAGGKDRPVLRVYQCERCKDYHLGNDSTLLERRDRSRSARNRRIELAEDDS